MFYDEDKTHFISIEIYNCTRFSLCRRLFLDPKNYFFIADVAAAVIHLYKILYLLLHVMLGIDMI